MNSTKNKPVSTEIMEELKDILQNPYAPPEPRAMAKACRQINRMREETRKKTGDLDVAVEFIREARE